MGQIIPAAVERYLASLNRVGDALLTAVEAEGRAARLPIVDAEVGALLQVLARAMGSRRILEIGTAIGYSGIWLGRALPSDGLLITVERDPERAAAARRNFARAGLGDRATVMVGDAVRYVKKLSGPFDLIFNDSDKAQYEPLLDPLVHLLRPGGVLVTDNVLWSGEVVPGFLDRQAEVGETGRIVAAYNERLASDPRLITSFLPLRDGLSVSVRIA